MSASFLRTVDMRRMDFLRTRRSIDTDSVVCNADLRAQILSRMSLGGLSIASSLNREWAAACEPFWKRLCFERWPECAQLHIVSYRSFFCRRVRAGRAQPQKWASIDAEDLCFLVEFNCGGGYAHRKYFNTEQYGRRQYTLPLGAQYNDDGSVPAELIDDEIFPPNPMEPPLYWPAVNPGVHPSRRIPLHGPQCGYRYKTMQHVASHVLKASHCIGREDWQDQIFVWDVPCGPDIDDWFAMAEFGATITVIAFRQSDQKMCTLLRDARCNWTNDGSSEPYFEFCNGEVTVPILKNRTLEQNRELVPAKNVVMEVGVSLDLKVATREQAPRDNHAAEFSLYVNIYDYNYDRDNEQHMPNVEECLRVFAQLEWK